MRRALDLINTQWSVGIPALFIIGLRNLRYDIDSATHLATGIGTVMSTK